MPDNIFCLKVEPDLFETNHSAGRLLSKNAASIQKMEREVAALEN
jgi:hypothetical protein